MAEDWDDLAGDVYELEAEVANLHEEVDQLTHLVIECRRHALSGCSDRVVEITEEFADE